MDSVNTSCGSLKFLIIAVAINGDITVIILQRSTGCIFKLKMEILILCWQGTKYVLKSRSPPGSCSGILRSPQANLGALVRG